MNNKIVSKMVLKRKTDLLTLYHIFNQFQETFISMLNLIVYRTYLSVGRPIDECFLDVSLRKVDITGKLLSLFTILIYPSFRRTTSILAHHSEQVFSSQVRYFNFTFVITPCLPNGSWHS